MENVTAKYISIRPYNRLYVGCAFTPALAGGVEEVTDHFDKKNKNCWQGAISSILEPLLEKCNITYIDETGKTIEFSYGDNVFEKLKKEI